MPKEKDEGDSRLGCAAHPHDGREVRKLVVGVVHATEVEDGCRLAEIDRLLRSHLVIRLCGGVTTMRALEHDSLGDVDASKVHVLVLPLQEDAAVRARVGVDGRTHVDARHCMLVELGATRLAVNECHGSAAKHLKTTWVELVERVVDHGRRLGRHRAGRDGVV